MLRWIFALNREKVKGWKKLYNKKLITCTFHKILLGWWNQRRWDDRGK